MPRLLRTSLVVCLGLLVVSAVHSTPLPGNWEEIGGIIRSGNSLIYDPVGNRLISFGGSAHGLPRNDVMVLNLNGPHRWVSLVVPGSAPAPREAHTACYDPVRHRMIISGGQLAGAPGHPQFASDTWALDLTDPSWERIATGAPGVREASLVYDAGRDRLVHYGGRYSLTNCSYESNAVDVLPLSPDSSWYSLDAGIPIGMPPPQARFAHAATYDATHDRMVVYGGMWGSICLGGFTLSDAWSLVFTPGPHWIPLATSGTAPSSNPVYPGWTSAPDAAGHRMVLYSADSNLGAWTLDLASDTAMWHKWPGQIPTAGNYNAIAFDGSANRLHVDHLGYTYGLTLDGFSAWQIEDTIPKPPSGRYDFASAFDTKRRRLIVFGASSDPNAWALSMDPPQFWSVLPGTGPYSYQTSGSAIYDPVRDRFVLYARTSSEAPEVWALNLSPSPSWTKLTTTGGPAYGRIHESSVYDPLADRMIVYGGFDGFATILNDVWALSLSDLTWTQIVTANPPPKREYHAAAFDPVQNRMTVFGGTGGGPATNDVWQLDLNPTPDWTQLSPQGTPPSPRVLPGVAYEPRLDRLIVHGGYDPGGYFQHTDLFALRLAGGGAWEQLFPGNPGPIGRNGHALAVDSLSNQIVLYGGAIGSTQNDQLTDDSWLLSLDDITTPALLALGSTFVDASGVHLEWVLGQASKVRIERRTEGTAWQTRAEISGQPGDNRFVDDEVLPGARYGYRLLLEEGASEIFGAETWVSVPAPAGFSLRAAFPNPVAGAFQVEMSLPTASAVRFELFDLRGRLMTRLGERSPGAGEWSVSLSIPPGVRSGAYVLRATQEGHSVARRVVVLQP